MQSKAAKFNPGILTEKKGAFGEHCWVSAMVYKKNKQTKNPKAEYN